MFHYINNVFTVEWFGGSSHTTINNEMKFQICKYAPYYKMLTQKEQNQLINVDWHW